MRFTELEYFIAVAEELHFGRAAKRVHIEQPPLSRRIKTLEEELGAKLFERDKRSVSLTPEGAYFLEEARAILERMRLAKATVSGMARGEAGELRIGFVTPVLHTPFSGAIREFGAAHPGVALRLRQESSGEQIRRLRSGDLHLGFIRPYALSLEGLGVTPFWSEPYALIMPAGHPLSRHQAVPIALLSGEPMLMFPRWVNRVLHDAIMAIFHAAGVSLNIVQEVKESQTSITLVEAGLGLALLPWSVTSERRPGLAYRPILGDLPPVEISIAWRRGRMSPMMTRFLDFLRGYLCAHPENETAERNRLGEQREP